MYRLGNGVQKNDEESAKWYKLSADGGFSASVNLANIYADGKGVKKDIKKAVSLYKDAAKKGNDMAQSNLAAMYLNGDGVLKDYVQAHAWSNIAAMIIIS